jgi:hypothetical protein
LIRIYPRNGQWFCEHQTQPRQRVVRREPGYDPQAAAAAAAAATIIGIMSQGVQPRTGGTVPQQRCHRNPKTGQIHCGSY